MLHISLIIGALLFQIIDFNQRKYEEALTRQSTRKSVGYAPSTPKSESLNASSKDINSTINENEKADYDFDARFTGGCYYDLRRGDECHQ